VHYFPSTFHASLLSTCNSHRIKVHVLLVNIRIGKTVDLSFIFYNRLHSKTRWKKVTKLIGTIAFPFLMCDKEKLKDPHHFHVQFTSYKSTRSPR
jgi:hypothetical protein